MSDTEARTLKWYRLRKFMKQEDLAKMVGVSPPTIRAWEAGRTTPRVTQLRSLSEALELSPEELLEAIEYTKKEAA